jgi:hypothetical protein
MKPKMLVLVVVLLLVAMIPALASAKSQAKPQKMVRVTVDITKPLGPQLDAQLGVTSRGPRAINAPGVARPRAGSNSIQPNAVYALLNTSFEAPNWPSTIGNADGFAFLEAGLSPVGWDATDYRDKRGNQSLFLWCSSTDGFFFTCDGHTGSTNGTWRLVTLDSKTSPIMADMLDEPGAMFGFIFVSDFIFTDEGTYIDPMRVRAWGP